MGKVRSLVCLFLIAGCAGTASQPEHWEGDGASIVAELCGDSPRAAPIAEPAASLRRRGLEAMHAGELVKARELFDEALQHLPNNVALVALAAAAEDGLRQGAVDTGLALDRLDPVELEPGEREPRAQRRAGLLRRSATLSVAERLHDDLGVFDPRPLDVKDRPHIPTVLRRRNTLQVAYPHPEHGVLIYVGPQGGPLVAQVERQRLRLADFSRYAGKPKRSVSVSHADFRDGHLYAAVSLDNKGFVVAHDRHRGTPLWRTPATVGANIVLAGDYLVTTRGDPASELVVLDRATGSELAREVLARPPAYLAHHQGKIFARALWPEEIAVFQLAGVKAGAERRDRSDRYLAFTHDHPASITIAAEHRCAIDRGVADLDAARYADANARLAALARVYPHHGLVVALGAAGRHMQRELDEPGLVDVSRIRFRKLAAARRTTARRVSGERALVRVAEGTIEDVSTFARRHGVTRQPFLPEELPPSLPRRIGRHPMTDWAAAGGERHVAVYGRRYILIVDGTRVEAALDGESLFSKKALEAGGGLRFALLAERSLFVSWTDSESGGGLAAIDPASGALHWRNGLAIYPMNFVLAGDHLALVTGSGLELTLLRRADGGVEHRHALDEVPRALASGGNRVLVNAARGTLEFEIAASARRALWRNGG